ncbi:MAG: DegT/DnrJ/EryC1/StrS family aminotransferase [Gemmatimonadales bacterium]
MTARGVSPLVGSVVLPIVRPTLPSLEELQPLLEQMWTSGIVTTGPIVRAFEKAVQDRLGVRRAVMVNHGTTALMLAARALALSGEVVISPFTWTATAGALVWDGLEPVFADVTPGRLTLDPQAAEAAITPRTTAIMPVNVFGVPPEMEAFESLCRRRGLKLLSDSAQGLGAMYRGRHQGCFGDAECFSLSPTKVVTAIEGGLVTTDDDALADAVVSMRDSGKNADSSDIVRLGLSGRPSEFHAAVGLKNFERMDALVAARHERMAWYRELLSGLPGVGFQEIPDDVVTTGNYFVVFVDESSSRVTRNALYKGLKLQGIETKRYFYPAVHLQGAYAHLRRRYEGRVPVAERAAAQGLAVPLYSHMTRADVERVCERLRDACSAA